MNEVQIKWTTNQIKNLVDYIAAHTPLQDEDFAELVSLASGITKASKDNKAVTKAVLGVIEVFDNMYKETK